MGTAQRWRNQELPCKAVVLHAHLDPVALRAHLDLQCWGLPHWFVCQSCRLVQASTPGPCSHCFACMLDACLGVPAVLPFFQVCTHDCQQLLCNVRICMCNTPAWVEWPLACELGSWCGAPAASDRACRPTFQTCLSNSNTPGLLISTARMKLLLEYQCQLQFAVHTFPWLLCLDEAHVLPQVHCIPECHPTIMPHDLAWFWARMPPA